LGDLCGFGTGIINNDKKKKKKKKKQFGKDGEEEKNREI